MAMMATKAQIAKVQVVYGQLAKREVGVESTREARLQWASELLNRTVSSFGQLRRGEAIHLIDQAQAALGLQHVPHTFGPDRVQARRAGLDGRKGDTEYSAQPQLVGGAEMAAIESFCERLGMTNGSFRAWLESGVSPLRDRADRRIMTTADANKVRWALKRMLVRRGLWEAA